MKLAQFSEKDPEANRDAAARVEKEMAEAIALDSRCEVVLPGAMPKRGTVVFTGNHNEKFNVLLLLHVITMFSLFSV